MDPMMPLCREPNEIIPEPDGADLNKAIECLCDWMHDTGIYIRYLNVYRRNHGWHVWLSLGKTGEQAAITREFDLGMVLSSNSWKARAHDMALEYMVKDLKEFKETEKGSDRDQ